jgi:hypothetical protein
MKKRVLFLSLISTALVLFVEGVAAIGLWISDGHVSFLELHEQQELCSASQFHGSIESEVLHPYLGWVLNPDLPGGVSLVGDQQHPVNEYGFLETGGSIVKRSPGKFVVAILGGSVAWYFATDGARTFREELARSPRFRDQEIIIVPLALSGFKQPQQLFTLQYFLMLGFEFDAVINIDGFNEVALHPAENAHRKVSISYPRSWYHRVHELATPENAESVYRILSQRRSRQEWAARFVRMPYRYSTTLNWIWRLRDNSFGHAINAAQQRIMAEKVSGEPPFLQTGPHRDYSSEQQVFIELAQLWQNCSLQLHRICEANDIAYYHLLQPNQYFDGSKPMSAEERAIVILPGHPYSEGVVKGYPLLKRSGDELVRQGVRFTDLTMLFENTQDQAYRDNCCHCNELGNKLLAQAVANAVISAD